jgi:hypothetical protein
MRRQQPMKGTAVRKRNVLTAVLAVALSGVTVLASSPAHASSHREAPLIAQDPVADNTDVYLFRDVENPTMVNIVANFIGLEDPAGGPNFARFGDDVLYEIHVDNDHDVVADITFQFRFRTIVASPDTFLYNTSTVDPTTYDELNVRQVYSVRKIEGGVSTVLASNVETPPVNVGPRSTPNYESYTDTALTPLGDDAGTVFAGQRDDAFFADLGSIFDLLGLRPINGAHVAPLPGDDGVDGLFEKSVHTISLQLPIASVTRTGTVPVVVDSQDSVIGVYASSSRQRVKVLSARGGAPRNLGQYVQVSRLGIPLVNEVLIPLGDKDRWNGTDPKDDAEFADSILDPEPTRLLPVVYPAVFDNTNTPPGGAASRTDLVQLLDGRLIGLTEPNKLPVADLLRINLAQLPVAGTVDNRLGALAADPGGFPNGRRLTDDVVDIELQVLAGVLLDDDGLIDGTDGIPYSALGDGVDGADQPLLATFPYQGTPVSGYDQSGEHFSCPTARAPAVC